MALENGQAATWTVSYAPDATSGAMKKINFYGSVNVAGCGDFWCNPDVLAAIPNRADDDLTVNRGRRSFLSASLGKAAGRRTQYTIPLRGMGYAAASFLRPW